MSTEEMMKKLRKKELESAKVVYYNKLIKNATAKQVASILMVISNAESIKEVKILYNIWKKALGPRNKKNMAPKPGKKVY